MTFRVKEIYGVLALCVRIVPYRLIKRSKLCLPVEVPRFGRIVDALVPRFQYRVRSCVKLLSVVSAPQKFRI